MPPEDPREEDMQSSKVCIVFISLLFSATPPTNAAGTTPKLHLLFRVGVPLWIPRCLRRQTEDIWANKERDDVCAYRAQSDTKGSLTYPEHESSNVSPYLPNVYLHCYHHNNTKFGNG
jgi:hypothetical protein